MASPEARHDSLLWIVLLVVLLFAVPGMFMMAFWTSPMMGFVGTGGFPAAGAAALLVAVVVMVVLLVLLVRAVERVPRPGPPVPPFPTGPMAAMNARDILDARYARGELPRDEYLRMREDLEPKRP